MPDIDIDRCRALAVQLPDGLRADWEGSNHYELTCPDPDNWWWLDVREAIGKPGDYVPSSEAGRRLGLVLDVATLFKGLVAWHDEQEKIIQSLTNETHSLRAQLLEAQSELAAIRERNKPPWEKPDYWQPKGWTHERKPGDPEPHFEAGDD